MSISKQYHRLVTADRSPFGDDDPKANGTPVFKDDPNLKEDIMDFVWKIVHAQDHYNVYINGMFFCSADTFSEAIGELETYEEEMLGGNK